MFHRRLVDLQLHISLLPIVQDWHLSIAQSMFNNEDLPPSTRSPMFRNILFSFLYSLINLFQCWSKSLSLDGSSSFGLYISLIPSYGCEHTRSCLPSSALVSSKTVSNISLFCAASIGKHFVNSLNLLVSINKK